MTNEEALTTLAKIQRDYAEMAENPRLFFSPDMGKPKNVEDARERVDALEFAAAAIKKQEENR